MKNHKDHRGSSGEERQRWHEWGVSEVIGVVLLLSLVVVGGTVVGTQFLSQPSPKEIPSVNFLANYDPGILTLYHTGGDTLPKDQYKFLVQYANGTATFSPTTDWSSGHPLTYPASSQPGKVTLVYTGNGAGDTALRSVVIGDVGNDTGNRPVTTPAGNDTQTFTVSASAHTGGTITPNGTMTVNAGENMSFTITAGLGFRILNLMDNGISKGPVSTYTPPPIQENHEIIASFEINNPLDHTITASAGSHGKVAPPGNVSVPDGSSQAFNFNPDAGYHLAKVTVDGQPAPLDNPYIFTNVISDHTITGAFAIDTFTITVNQQGKGNVSPGTVSVEYNSTPTFTFTPDTGHHLANVTVDGAPGTTTNTAAGAIYTFPPVTRGHNLNATFAPDAFTITVTPPQHGTITPNGTVDVFYGDTPNFTFTPDTGYRLAGVTVDDTPGTTSGTTYTFPAVNASHRLAATFEAITCTITVSASLGGNITTVTSLGGTVTIPPGTSGQQVTVTYGEQPTFTFTPDVGSHITEVSINRTAKGPIATYTFPQVIDNSNTVAATFEANVYTVNVTSGQNGSVQANEKTAAAGTTTIVTVGYNGQVNFTYLPTIGHHIDTVSYTAEDGSQKQLPIVNNASTLSGIKSNTTVMANFAVDRFTITVTPPVHGSIIPNSTITVDYNGTPTFTFTPVAGYHLGTVTVDGTPVTPAGNTYTFPPVTGSHTLAATFVVDTFTINASAGNHGTINPSGNVPVNYGENKDFIITADTGYHLTNVMVDSTPQTVPAGNTSYYYRFPTITSDHTINASFVINTYTITATAGDHGTISPNGTLTVDYGSSKTFNITPVTGYKVADVKVDNVSQGALSTYTFSTIQTAHTISASFEQIMYTVTANTGPLGMITPSGSLSYAYHAIPNFTVGAIPGYHIANIIVDEVLQGSAPNYTFSPLEANHTITADFAKNVYTITASAGSGGSITPAGNVNVNYGDNQSFTITPSSGYNIDDVVVDGISMGQVNLFNFTQVNGNHIIQAFFDTSTVGPYSIAGYIWNDKNNNGVWDSGEPPLAGWTVQAQGKGHAQDWYVVNQSTSDSTGYYIIDNLPKDHYHVVQVQHSGWDQTYPTQHNGYDVENLNHGRADKHQQVTGDDFGNHMTTITGNQILLNNPMNIGVLKDGTYIRFTGAHWVKDPQPAHTDDWIQMDPSATIVPGLDIVSGKTFRIPWQTEVKIVMDGDQSTGQIYIYNTEISTYQFDHVKVYFNGNLVATGKINGIWVHGYTNWQSTLTYAMGSYNSGAQFVVNGTDIIDPPWWPHQDWGVNVYGISPQSPPYNNVLNFNYKDGKTYLVCSGTYDMFTA